MSDRLIYHIFADVGVEAEVLSGYGRVVRVGLDPLDTNESEPIRADATSIPLEPGADLAVFHPPCQRWARSTVSGGGDRDEHPNLIPLARHLGETLAEDYIIENVPRAPLRPPEGGDKVELDGRMFGLPIPRKRAFETSFPLPDPPSYDDVEAFGALKAHREAAQYVGTSDVWRSVVGVSGDYPAREMKREGTPAAMIHWLIRAWLQPIPPRRPRARPRGRSRS